MRWSRFATLSLPLAAYAFAACSGDDSNVGTSDAGVQAPHDASSPGNDASSGNDGQAAQDAAQDAAHDSAPDADAGPQGLAKINHFVVIYMENHSFDNLYGEFPGVDGVKGLDAGSPNVIQLDGTGTAYATLPPPPSAADAGFPSNLANAPFSIEDNYKPADAATPDLHHIFFTEQFQINGVGGNKMNQFVYWSDAKGLSMGYYHTMSLPVPKEAVNWTVCDRFFHAAFGGSFLNHQFLIAAAPPQWANYPTDAGIVDIPDAIAPGAGEGQVTSDGYVVNTSFSVNSPHPYFSVAAPKLVPNLTNATIGDRLSAANLTWAWYSGGWNDAMAWSNNPDGGTPSPSIQNFQYHHQPFVYYANYADGTAAKTQHLKDEQDFMAAAAAGTLPAVSFIKPVGIDNEHPGYTDVLTGDQHLLALINAIKASPNWNDTAIIITYDEHGGFWDHVPPPVVDRFGPGSRVPTIIISKYAKTGYVDHTVYDTMSILATIEKRWSLTPLTARDTNATPLLNAFDFTKP
jgi:phospholipase C